MKTTLSALGLLLVFTQIPYNLYLTYLLYAHVGATPVMWTLWIIQIPFLLLMTIISETLRNLKD